MTRQKSNILILELLAQRVRESPDERFTQMLFNLDVTRQKPCNKIGEYPEGYIDNYNEESEETLKNIRHRLNRLDDTGKIQEVS